MGTIYRTDCGCIASSPEPDFANCGDWAAELTAWADEWAAVAYAHTRLCPRSAYYTGTLTDPRD